MKALRTKDTYQKQVYDFMKDMYVVCPSCGGQAIVKIPDTSKQHATHNTRLLQLQGDDEDFECDALNTTFLFIFI